MKTVLYYLSVLSADCRDRLCHHPAHHFSGPGEKIFQQCGSDIIKSCRADDHGVHDSVGFCPGLGLPVSVCLQQKILT